MERVPPNSLLAWTRATLLAGCAGAIVEMVFVLPIQAMLGASPERVMQSIAAAVLGRDAFSGGLLSTLIGVGLHLAVSLIAAGCYAAAALWWDTVLVEKPVVSGLTFGVIVYAAMNYAVVPSTLLGFVPPKSLPLLWASLGVHLVAFGLPIALVTRAALRPSLAMRPKGRSETSGPRRRPAPVA